MSPPCDNFFIFLVIQWENNEQNEKQRKEKNMQRHLCQYESVFSDGVLTIRLGGEIDHHSAVNVRTSLDEEICRLRPQKTVLDLAEIEFMDSSGLGLIMGRYSLMQKLGGTLTLKSPNERLMKIFELAGLGRIIRIEEDGEEESK